MPFLRKKQRWTSRLHRLPMLKLMPLCEPGRRRRR
jgi:hypothetical protein